MKKHYSLIVDGHFSLSNETDADPMSDYSPGIWAIKTQKRALQYAKELLADGDTITVTCYNNARHYPMANKFIKELGLSQPLFEEIALPVSDVTNDKPHNLAQFKKFLVPGMKLRVVQHLSEGDRERIAEVLTVGGSNFTCSKSPDFPTSKVWTEFGKATDWSFHNDKAVRWYVWDGKAQPSSSYYYL